MIVLYGSTTYFIALSIILFVKVSAILVFVYFYAFFIVGSDFHLQCHNSTIILLGRQNLCMWKHLTKYHHDQSLRVTEVWSTVH